MPSTPSCKNAPPRTTALPHQQPRTVAYPIAELLKLRTFYAVAVQRETPTIPPLGEHRPVRFVG
ncbi:hypothetical protein LOK82_09795 [Xylella fastidiosa subsp. multiplex]|uniref:Uncharacterized protein n=1 Tax=Xylella fastidiosa subsp. multiplex TaxID=644357 RepID=A0AAW6HW73_XYLFS|nr:hypothetical protein [Xylella fastidiosa subsp. multiplex]